MGIKAKAGVDPIGVDALQAVGGAVVVVAAVAGPQGAGGEVVQGVVAEAAIAPQVGGVGGTQAVLAVIRHAPAFAIDLVGYAGDVGIGVVGVNVLQDVAIGVGGGQAPGVLCEAVGDAVA